MGAAKQMHTIIASECTGCELCIAPCPVDCISMVTIGENVENWKWKYPVYALKSVPPKTTSPETQSPETKSRTPA